MSSSYHTHKIAGGARMRTMAVIHFRGQELMASPPIGQSGQWGQ
jgi:hypothetical protein